MLIRATLQIVLSDGEVGGRGGQVMPSPNLSVQLIEYGMVFMRVLF